jgi:uncharacterized protein YfkK (UPF0435 family)
MDSQWTINTINEKLQLLKDEVIDALLYQQKRIEKLEEEIKEMKNGTTRNT